jgi:hypothetical protein
LKIPRNKSTFQSKELNKYGGFYILAGVGYVRNGKRLAQGTHAGSKLSTRYFFELRPRRPEMGQEFCRDFEKTRMVGVV